MPPKVRHFWGHITIAVGLRYIIINKPLMHAMEKYAFWFS